MPQKYHLKKHHSLLFVVLVLGVLVIVALLYKRHDVTRTLEQATLPEAQNYQEVKDSKPLATSEPTTEEPAAATPKTETSSKNEINLAVPFTVQAPHANWDLPYKEFCEEASTLMAASYLKGEDIGTTDEANQKLLAVKAFEEKEFGFYEDTTIEQTAVILKKHFGIKNVDVLDNPTPDDFREALNAGKLVIMPAAGRELGNPFFTAPGPLYHMLVIKGYTGKKFITNDPGTRRGADYVYSEDVLFSAMHDWHGDGNIDLGKKVVLIVG